MQRTSPSTRPGFTLIEAAALTTLLGVTACALAVGINSNEPARAATSQPPDDPIADLRKELDDLRTRVEALEAQAGSAPKPAVGNEPLLGALTKARASARQLKDSTQVRGIVQSMVVWANNNNGQYPLPSALDTANQTVRAASPDAKNTTANIYSLLIFSGHVTTEMLVSPAETNPAIKPIQNYEFANPKTAVKAADALWDPAFSADFTAGKTGNTSYAHLQPSAGRLPNWSDTYNTAEPQVGLRGPQITGVERAAIRDTVKAPAASNTYAMFGAPDTWEGNIAFADGRVEFVQSLAPTNAEQRRYWLTYTTPEGKRQADIYHYDEPDDPAAANAFLGIFTTAGKAAADFTPIWD